MGRGFAVLVTALVLRPKRGDSAVPDHAASIAHPSPPVDPPVRVVGVPVPSRDLPQEGLESSCAVARTEFPSSKTSSMRMPLQARRHSLATRLSSREPLLVAVRKLEALNRLEASETSSRRTSTALHRLGTGEPDL